MKYTFRSHVLIDTIQRACSAIQKWFMIDILLNSYKGFKHQPQPTSYTYVFTNKAREASERARKGGGQKKEEGKEKTEETWKRNGYLDNSRIRTPNPADLCV